MIRLRDEAQQVVDNLDKRIAELEIAIQEEK